MPYTIPSSVISPGAVYQPRQIPAVVSQNARALYYTRGGSTSSSLLLDQSPLNSGTRRTGEEGRDYLYDGVDDYSTLDSVITLSGDLSLSFWAKRTDITKYHIIFNDGALLTPKVGFDISTDNLFIRFSGASVWLANSGVDTTTWNHYVITRTAGVAKAYVNGIDLGTTSTASGSGDFVFSSISTFTVQLYKGNLFDIRIYNKALSQEEVDFVYSFGKTGTNPSLPVNWWKCDEQSGVIGYDSVGGNNLTHTNITAGTFHATQDIWSFQNQVGFNTSGAVYIPRDESDTANDVLGNPLTNTGRRPNDAEMRGSSCLTLNGTNQAVRVPDNAALDITDNLTVCFWARNNNASIASNTIIVSKYNSVGDQRSWQIYLDASEKLNIGFGNPANGNFIGAWKSANSVDVDSNNNYSFTFSSGVLTVYINGVEISGSVSLGSIPSTLHSGTSDLILGGTSSGASIAAFWDGQLFDARIYAGDSTVLTAEQIAAVYADGPNNIQFAGQALAAHYKLAEGGGTQCLDASGNENHGTIENAATNWSVTQDVYHSNLLNGFSLYEHASSDPIRVPFDITGSPILITPPTGYSKTSDNYPGDYHNNAETLIDLDPDSTPEMGTTQLGITVPASHAFGDAFAASDQIFSRQRTLTEDRFVVMPEAQTGSALATIQRYTQP